MIQKDGTNEFYYYGHMSEIRVKVGDKVKVTDVIGIEGSTGYSTGSHCHYECRLDDTKSKHQNISEISGIPNAIGTYDDGYRQPTVVKTLHAKIVLAGETWEGDLEEVKT